MKIALLGYGRMGEAVAAQAEGAGHTVVARLRRADLTAGDPGVVATRMGKADVAVDFSIAEQVPRSVAAAAACGVDLVIGTTGWHPGHVDLHAVTRAGRGVVYGANFSLGVHVFLSMVRQAARVADAVDGYDVHVVETHHRHKRDHPSGTALRVTEVLLDELNSKTRWAPSPPLGAADPRALYVTSVRTGEVPGTHVVGFEGADDRLELRHEARGRTGFARGAVWAATWIVGRTGVFTFDEAVADLIEHRNEKAEREKEKEKENLP